MDYEQWFSKLDSWGAKDRTYKEISAYLREEGLSPWWAQKVTIHYEQARGLREAHERKHGFAITVSKTVNAPAATLFDAFVDGRKRRKWLAGAPMKVRTSTRPRSARFDWKDGTRVNVDFVPKDASKTTVAVDHVQLKSRAEAERMKAMWREHLARLHKMSVL